MPRNPWERTLSLDGRSNGLFKALSCRDFRILWAGLTLSQVGYWIQTFALGILLVELASREHAPELAPFYLGLLGLARAAPGLVLTPVAGAVADRIDRRRLLLFTQTTMMLACVALTSVTLTGNAAVWNVLIFTAILSGSVAFDNPARQSLVARVVPRQFLPSAIGLQSASFNGGAMVGPLVAAVLYAPIGVPGLLALNTLGYAAMLGSVMTIKPIPLSASSGGSLLASVGQGAQYIARDGTMRWVLIIAATVFAAAGPMNGLVPAVAGDAMVGSISWLGLVLAAMGIGSFTGSFGTMNVSRLKAPGIVFVLAGLLNGAALVVFAVSLNPLLTLISSFLAGIAATLFAGMGNNMLQATTTDEYRGRVMSVWALQYMGLLPIGQFLLGTLGSVLGIRLALLVGGAVAVAAGAYGMLRVPALRDWRLSTVASGQFTEPATAGINP